MLGTTVLDDMAEDQVLAFVGTCAETVQDAEVGLLRGARQWAIMHSPDRLDADEAEKPGREQARAYGGAGTPEVMEFAAAELGARIGRSTFAAGQLMADALDLERHPVLKARVEAGEVRVSYARHVVSRTRDLSQEEAGFVDAAVAESADGRIPWSRFEALVEAKVAQASPEAAREKEERARKATFAKRLRAEAHGMGSYLVRAPMPMIEQIAAVVDAYSGAIAEDFPDLDEDQRHVQAVLMLLTPGADQDPAKLADVAPVVNLYVHTYAGPDNTGIARLEGHGPVTEDWVRDTLGPTCRFKIYPVLDLEGMAPVDAYEIPDRHRQAVHLMTPADTFPYGSSLSREQQVDHTIPHDRGGASGVGNYGPMTVTHHRIKTHGRWEVQQPFAGIYVWRDPHGAHYLVDHTGTRRVPGEVDTPARLMVIEFWHGPDVRLDWAA
jgi:hypothetical protein